MCNEAYTRSKVWPYCCCKQNREIDFAVICVSLSGQRCLEVSAPGWETCWGLNWRLLWIFHVPNMNTLVGFGVLFLFDDH